MKNWLILLLVLVIIGCLSFAESEDFKNPSPLETDLQFRVSKASMPFISNIGQMNDSVLYYAQTIGGYVYVTKSGEIIYSFWNQKNENVYDFHNSRLFQQIGGLAIKETFVNGNITKASGEGDTKAKVNYFLGNDASEWKKNIPVYKTVYFSEVYAGIDVKLKAYGNNLEKLLYVEPKAKPEDIKIKIEGCNDLTISEKDELIINTEFGSVTFTKPKAFQDFNGTKKHIPVEYTIDGNEYGFKIGKYNPERTLVIDPLLASTFVGGSDKDDTYEPSITIDNSGNVYITGFTSSHDFPTTVGAFSKKLSGGSTDRFVSKFNNDLSELLVSTFLGGRGERGGIIGGNGDELGHAISVDNDGNVYLAGYTESTDFPVTTGSFDESYNGGRDVFVSKLNGDLSALLASTYIGGCGDEGFQWPRIDMTIDQIGDVYVAGITHSTDFPTSDSAFDRTFSGGLRAGDAFVAKLDKNLTKLLAATYIGGSGNEWRISVIVDGNKSVIISGETESPDFPTTPGAYDNEANRYRNIIKDIFISRLSLDLSKLEASTYFGGKKLEEALKIRIDENGDIYAAGYTESMDFPTTRGAYSREWNGGQRDAFIAKFNSTLSQLIASTLFGGSIRDMARSIVLDKQGDIYVTGVTASPDFPVTPGAYVMNFRSGSPNQRDAFVTKFSSDLNKLLASSTFGGSVVDDAYCIEIDGSGDIFIAGLTSSNDFPTTENAFDNSYNNGGNDCFIVKFDKKLSEKNN